MKSGLFGQERTKLTLAVVAFIVLLLIAMVGLALVLNIYALAHVLIGARIEHAYGQSVEQILIRGTGLVCGVGAGVGFALGIAFVIRRIQQSHALSRLWVCGLGAFAVFAANEVGSRPDDLVPQLLTQALFVMVATLSIALAIWVIERLTIRRFELMLLQNSTVRHVILLLSIAVLAVNYSSMFISSTRFGQVGLSGTNFYIASFVWTVLLPFAFLGVTWFFCAPKSRSPDEPVVLPSTS